MSLLQQSRRRITLGQDGNTLILLIAVNVIIYILLSFVKMVYLTDNSTEGAFVAQVLSWISVPAQPAVFATRPWTILTYMFAHNGVWDLLSSMLWLWGFGSILQSLAGNRKLVPVYIYGGLTGSVFFLISSNLIPSISANVNSVFPLLGSGPALMAIAVAATVLAPKYKVFPMINLPLWVLTLVFALLRIGTIGSGNLSHAIALIAGGVMGFVFVWQLQKGNDWGQWMTNAVEGVDGLFNPAKKHRKNPVKKQLFYKATQKPFEKRPVITQQRIDDLLDKINYKGYNSLTEEEKEFLKKASSEEL